MGDEASELVRLAAENATLTTRVAELEEQLQISAAALERSREEFQNFAYVASHDLQEPLRMVASFTQLLADRYRDKLDEKAHGYIHYAVDGARRMQGLLEGLLALSRVNTRGEPLRPVASREVVNDALPRLRKQIAESRAELSIGELPEVLADRAQLQQVFHHLLDNALKFRGEAPIISLSARAEDGQWRFEVADNGLGIEARHFERVFTLFQRLHTREAYPGTGMGLALAKKIVERHGGRLWVESEAGVGSRFFFTLPAVAPGA